MVKYYVYEEGHFNTPVYEGFDRAKALLIQEQRNECCSGCWDIFEEEIELEWEDDNNCVVYESDVLTALWGDDEAGKRILKEFIEAETGRKVKDFHFDTTEPVDVGDNADFYADNIIWANTYVEDIKCAVKDKFLTWKKVAEAALAVLTEEQLAQMIKDNKWSIGGWE